MRIVLSPAPAREMREYVIANLANLLAKRYALTAHRAATVAPLLDMACAQAAMAATPVPSWFARCAAGGAPLPMPSAAKARFAANELAVRSAYTRNVQHMMDAVVCRGREEFEAAFAADGCASWLHAPGGPQHELWKAYVEGRRRSIVMLHEDWKSIAEHLHKGNHRCPVCSGKNVAPRDKQTRRGDEGSTIFYHCHDCDKVFRIA